MEMKFQNFIKNETHRKIHVMTVLGGASSGLPQFKNWMSLALLCCGKCEPLTCMCHWDFCMAGIVDTGAYHCHSIFYPSDSLF